MKAMIKRSLAMFHLCVLCVLGAMFTSTSTAYATTCSSGTIDVDGTCVAGKFAVKTTNLNAGDTFEFSLSAIGTFTVDCGVDGTLTSSASDVTNNNTITRSDIKQIQQMRYIHVLIQQVG